MAPGSVLMARSGHPWYARARAVGAGGARAPGTLHLLSVLAIPATYSRSKYPPIAYQDKLSGMVVRDSIKRRGGFSLRGEAGRWRPLRYLDSRELDSGSLVLVPHQATFAPVRRSLRGVHVAELIAVGRVPDQSISRSLDSGHTALRLAPLNLGKISTPSARVLHHSCSRASCKAR
jgi:hypothetical protein